MPRIDVHWVHAHGDWRIPGYEVHENPEQCNGNVGILIDHAVLNAKLRHAYEIIIVILHEPRPKQRHVYEAVAALHKQFLAIITYDCELLKLPNVYLLPVGGTRIELPAVSQPKTRQIAMVASWKCCPGTIPQSDWDMKALDGYPLRWRAAHSLMGRGIEIHGSIGHGATELGPSLQSKTNLLASAEFAVEVECHKAHNWFTEKLLDCLMLDVVPIYRGPDNIGDYFNTQGMLLWNTPEELVVILDQILAGEIKYEDFWPHILINRQRAGQWAYLPESYCRVVATILQDRITHIDIYDPYPNIQGLFWHRDGYELHMNPVDREGDVAVFWDGMIRSRIRRDAYKTKFAVLHEPRCKEPKNYQVVRATCNEWAGIFTHDPDLLGTTNTIRGLAACTWAGPQGHQSLAPNINHDKPVSITMINSDKARPTSKLDGYRMRFAAAQELIKRGIIVYGTGGTVPTPCPENVAAGKLAVLAPAQFSVEAECHKRDNWFTEKLIDCFLLMVVPIYYGPDNITNYFATESMLCWNTKDELCEILDCIQGGQIQYRDFFPALQYAHASALLYTYPPQRHLDKIVEILEANAN